MTDTTTLLDDLGVDWWSLGDSGQRIELAAEGWTLLLGVEDDELGHPFDSDIVTAEVPSAVPPYATDRGNMRGLWVVVG
jgi:hypothetical protein